MSIEFNIDSEIIFNGWDHTRYELQEDIQRLLHLGGAPIKSDCVDDFFHYFGVIARVDTCLLHAEVRVGLHCHGLLSVISHNVFKDFFF